MTSLSYPQTCYVRTATRATIRVIASTVALFAAAAGAHAQTGTAIVRNTPRIAGRVDGSVQILKSADVFLHERNTVVTGDLLVPGTPQIVQHGRAAYGGTIDAAGAAEPSNYRIVLGGGVSLRHVVRRTDPVAMPEVAAPAQPTGTRKVVLRFPGQSEDDFTTLRDLTIHRDLGAVVVPSGTYGDFTANDDSSFVLGVAGATTPAVYNFQKLTLNGGSRLQVVGPVIVNIASGLMLNRDHDRRGWRPERREHFCFGRDDDYDVAVGSAQHPEWLVLNLASGGLSLNRDDSFHGFVNAPAGVVSLEDHCSLVGGVVAAGLKIHDRSRVTLLERDGKPPTPNQPPTVTLQIAESVSTAFALSAVKLQATASDSDGTVVKVEFYQGDALLGSSTAVPFEYVWSNLAAGTYTLTAKATDNLGASTASAPVAFTVNKVAASLTLGGLAQVYDGIPKSATVGVMPVGLNIVVTYNGSSTLPVNAGSYMVVATVDDANYAGSVSGSLIISPVVPTISWSAPSDIFYGTALSSAQLNATASVPGSFTYSPSVGTVLGAGAAQQLSAVFTPADPVNYTTASGSTTINVSKALATVSLSGLSATYDGTSKAVTATTAPAGLSIALTYDGAAAAPTAAGTYTVVAVVNDSNYFGSATGSLTISKATPALSWTTPADITYGTALNSAQLNATANVAGTFAYTPAEGTVLNAGAAQSLSAAFTPADPADYNAGSVSTTIKVNKATAVVTLSNLGAIYDGLAKNVTVTTQPAGLNVLLTYDGSTVAPTAAGTYAVLATVDDPNFVGAATGTLEIAKATPVVTWASPADITQGTALSAVQLNATANVQGVFAYSPAAGTVLSSGVGQVLSVLFTPVDMANYSATGVYTTINVLQPTAANIAVDGVSSGTITSATTTLTWNHTLTAGAGTSRILVVGVSSRGSSVVNANVSGVKFNGVSMIPLDGSAANAGSTTVNRSQQFYLLDSALPGAGTYPVVVTFGVSQSAGNNPSGGAISLINVSQEIPAGFSNSTGTATANNISTTVSAAAGAWVVDNIGVGSTNAKLATAATGMTAYYNITQTSGLPNSGAAGSTKTGDFTGFVTMAWTSATGRIATSLAVLTPAFSVPTAPMITTQPVAQSVNVGSSVTLSVAATGSAPLSYQWYKNSLPIAGATSTVYKITNAQPADTGVYAVVVSNSVGSVSSDLAAVNVDTAFPVITAQPLSQTVNLGDSVTLTVVAVGAEPLSYQWYKYGEIIYGATSASLTLTNVGASDAGAYYVSISNDAGMEFSNDAVVTVNTALVAPSITLQPATQAVGVGATVTLSVVATGTPTLYYQWQKDGVNLLMGTTSTYTIYNAQAADAGVYQVVVTNSASSVTSDPAALSVNPLTEPSAIYNLTGFATLGTGCTGGGVVAETDSSYRKVYTALDLAQAIKDSKTVGAVKVIEIMNDLNLGWNEIDSAVKGLASTPFRSHNAPKLHPALILSGVSLIDIQSKPGLTIFSANGATIRHATFNFKGTSNIIVRNLKFDEMWEWDEATKGDYDSNDWDFIDLSNGSAATNVWIDHCTFTKTYDGIVDMKAGTQYVTMSWCKYVGDDGATNPNSFVRQQIAYLEANRSSNTFYNFLRTNGFSVEDIVQIIQGHDKCHLLGSNSLDASNATLSATFHHQWFNNIWDRCVPRLRAGQVHNYNIFVDDSVALAAKRLRDARVAGMSASAKTAMNSTYSFNPFLNGSISTEGGAILVEKSIYMDCLTPLRNNQTDVTNPVYTGKILSTDSVFIFHESDGTTTTQRGDSTDVGSRMGPFQAAIIPFSWNTTDGSRPYPAPAMHDPADLEYYLTQGAGAGKISWSKENWLRTSY